MKLAVIDKITRFIGNPDVNADDANFFHGIGQRNGIWYPNEPDGWANLQNVANLEVARIKSKNVPAITKPASLLVVDEAIANSLSWGPRINLVPANVIKQVEVDYVPGPSGWKDFLARYNGQSISEILRESPDSDQLLKPNLYELRIWTLADAALHFQEHNIGSSRTTRVNIDDNEAVELTTDLLQEFGVLWHRGRIIVSETLSHILLPFFDSRFFRLSVFEI